jgi:hypothetical protein
MLHTTHINSNSYNGLRSESMRTPSEGPRRRFDRITATNMRLAAWPKNRAHQPIAHTAISARVHANATYPSQPRRRRLATHRRIAAIFRSRARLTNLPYGAANAPAVAFEYNAAGSRTRRPEFDRHVAPHPLLNPSGYCAPQCRRRRARSDVKHCKRVSPTRAASSPGVLSYCLLLPVHAPRRLGGDAAG